MADDSSDALPEEGEWVEVEIVPLVLDWASEHLEVLEALDVIRAHEDVVDRAVNELIVATPDLADMREIFIDWMKSVALAPPEHTEYRPYDEDSEQLLLLAFRALLGGMPLSPVTWTGKLND